jgi:hypothetical protein
MASTEEEFILLLSNREHHIIDSELMITVPASACSQPLDLQSSSTSSMGDLDILPLEILYSILNDLGILSLSRLAAVSHRGHDVVHSSKLFRELMNHAYPALVALSSTKLLSMALQRNSLLGPSIGIVRLLRRLWPISLPSNLRKMLLLVPR